MQDLVARRVDQDSVLVAAAVLLGAAWSGGSMGRAVLLALAGAIAIRPIARRLAQEGRVQAPAGWR